MNKLKSVFTVLLLATFSSLSSAKPSAPAVSVYSDVVETHGVSQSLSLIGKLQSKQFVNITSEVTAKVTRIAVKANQHVKKGQLLVQLDNGKARALLTEANAFLLDEQRKLKEYEPLIKKQAITQTQYDGQVATVEIAKARLLAAKVFVENHRLVAPFAGTIGLIDFSQGKIVSAGEALLTLDNLSQMTLDLAVPERYLSMLNIGMNVTATSRAWNGTTFSGKVMAIDSRINPDTLNLRVRLLFDNKDNKLKPGMMMSSQLVFDEVNEPIIAVQALEYSGTKRFVYVINKDSKVERREVILGARIRDEALIESGLEIGERIVVQGLVNMRDGLKVKDLGEVGGENVVPTKAKNKAKKDNK
ncbi:efflux RND transporter periplasmic adaptor subunit [Psychromonas sp. RZ22]|uniref:efflux RND transporter periplasmic adaptor subunit n=1 Tax=Psychromonas algarum TaxID=2555643 RepID=UPI00106857E9|nr:efflux RND transporter periplasmic adaptor subunit [Psychromonas sp. RZ22]TEW56501.1 efflux RND transporter periplasmic adaptor subunit [Psychromonas sp. RZ22]